MSEPQKPALVELAANNQIVVVADIDHRSEMIPDAITAQLPAMAQEGMKHLFIEVDPNETNLADVISRGDAFGRMVTKAQALGVEVVPVDDRSRQRARNARYPEEATFMKEQDVYGADVEALINASPNPERMRAYLNERQQNVTADTDDRNLAMTNNIAESMKTHPNDKALVVVGAAHANQRNDIDEMLRVRGFQTVTAQIKASDAEYLPSLASAPDKADITLDAFTGQATAVKNTETGRVQRVVDPATIHWRNEEAVAETHSDAMRCAMNAAKEVQCSWNQGLNKTEIPHFTAGETGKMASPSTQRQAASPEPDGPPR